MGLFDKQVKRTGKGLFSTENNPYDTSKVDKQIENARIRIEDSGYKPEDTDRRNWFERATNLPKGQNWFFDTLELLGRGGNAVKNTIDKSFIKGVENPGVALYKGISGKEKVSGADLAEDFGIDNKVGKFALGTALDIGLDPATYIPGGALAKGIGAVAKPIRGALKAGYTAVEAASPALKTLRETKLAPIGGSIKDGLGYMFKPGYKQDETLFGDQSDFLKKLQTETENSRRFNQGEIMNTVTNAAKDVGLDKGTEVGRVMEQNAPVYGPKPFREIPDDPKILDAAETLMNKNAELRQLAADNGIDIQELAGYMTHVWSKAEREQRGILKPKFLDRGQFNQGNPNKDILNKRKYEGSVEDINQQVGREMFEPNAFFASAIGQQRLNDYIHAVAFRRKVLSNTDFAVKYEEGMQIPKNAVIVDTNKYTFLKDSGDILDGVVPADSIGGRYVVTKAAKQLLDRYQTINTDEGTKAFLKTIGALQGTWKKLALFSPGFHIRNVAGAGWNMYAAGMNPADIGNYVRKSVTELTQVAKGAENPMYREFREQGLDVGGLTQSEYGQMFKDPESIIQKEVESKSKPVGKRIVSSVMPQNLFNTSRNIGEKSDEAMKFAMYQWARTKLKLDPAAAAAKVKEALFDYTDLTPFEQKARLLIPFYSWSRKNIPFQVKKFIDDPKRFANLNKIRTNAQDAVGLDDENVPNFMKEGMAIPVSGENGKGKYLGLNLPVADLTKLSSPLKLLTDSVSPLLKTPMEIATNYNMFRGKPIQKFEGQTLQLQVPGTDAQVDIPIRLAYALQALGGQVGRGVTQYLQKPGQEDQDNKFRVPSLGINSIVKPFDAEQSDYYQKLDELRQLQDLILYIQQQEGAKPRTIAEINRGR
jgi:hypothetical protein